MFLLLSRYWNVMILRGALRILLAFVVFSFPTLALASLALLLSTVLLTDGVLVLWVSLHQQQTNGWKTHLLEGVTGLLFGTLMLMYQNSSMTLILTTLAGWAVITGIIGSWSALHMLQGDEDEFWLGLSGVFGVTFGVLLLLFPMSLHSVVMTSVGTYSIIAGTILSIVGLSLRQHLKDLRRRPTQVFF